MVLLIYKTGVLENGDEVVKVTVDVGDGDYGFRRLRWGLGWSRPRQPRRQQNQENGKTSAVGRNMDQRADHFPASYSQAPPDLSEIIEFRRMANFGCILGSQS
jgi:hypothetical protein